MDKKRLTETDIRTKFITPTCRHQQRQVDMMTHCPPAHTLYRSKPLAGHNLMLAIARVNRVNRVYGDKPAAESSTCSISARTGID